MWLVKRLKEPSTWAGLSLLAGVFGLPPEYLPVIAKIGAAVGAVAAVVLPEALSQ